MYNIKTNTRSSNEECICRWAIGKEFSLDLDPFLILILTLSVIHAHFVSGGETLLTALQLCVHPAFCNTYLLIVMLSGATFLVLISQLDYLEL